MSLMCFKNSGKSVVRMICQKTKIIENTVRKYEVSDEGKVNLKKDLTPVK
jgi:hypothetical protein